MYKWVRLLVVLPLVRWVGYAVGILCVALLRYALKTSRRKRQG